MNIVEKIFTTISNEGLNYKPNSLASLIPDNYYLPVVVILLLLSNVFMTFAWYHHLNKPNMTFIYALATSLVYVIFEYTANIHANSIGYKKYSGYTLKILQEAVTLTVFIAYAWLVLGEKLTKKKMLSFGAIFTAVWLAVND